MKEGNEGLIASDARKLYGAEKCFKEKNKKTKKKKNHTTRRNSRVSQ